MPQYDPNSVMAALYGGGGGGSSSQSGTQVVPEMMDVYRETLGLNQKNYQNILDSYSGAQNRLAATLPGIYQGYDKTRGRVADILGYGGKPYGILSGEVGIENEKAGQRAGQIQQDLINRGLGNTTVLGNMANQSELFRRRAVDELGAKLAGMYAGSEERIGMAGLGAQLQGLNMQTGLSQNQAGVLGNYRFANTAGNLTGGYSQSQSSRPNPNDGYAASNVGGGGRGRLGGRGGYGGVDEGASGPKFNPYTQGSGASSYNPFTHQGGQGGGYGGAVGSTFGGGFGSGDYNRTGGLYGPTEMPQGYNVTDLQVGGAPAAGGGFSGGDFGGGTAISGAAWTAEDFGGY